MQPDRHHKHKHILLYLFHGSCSIIILYINFIVVITFYDRLTHYLAFILYDEQET